MAFTMNPAEILTAALSNVPFSSATSWTAFTVSTWLSVSIFATMLFTLLIIFFYPQPNLSLQPNTIAVVLYYLSRSHSGGFW